MRELKCYECHEDVEKHAGHTRCTRCLQPIDAKGMPYKLDNSYQSLVKARESVKVAIEEQICYFNDCDNEESIRTTNDRSKTTCDKCTVRLRFLDYGRF